MALSTSALSALIRANMLSKANLGAVDGDALTELCDAVAEAVVDHIQTSAVVPPGIPVSGSATIGPGTVL